MMSSEDQNKKLKKESSNKSQEDTKPSSTEWLLKLTELPMKELLCMELPSVHQSREDILPKAQTTTLLPDKKSSWLHQPELHGEVLKISRPEPSQVM